MRKGGEPDTDFAGRWLIQAFREGKLGRWTLDSLGRGGEAVDAEEALEQGEDFVPRRSYLEVLPGEEGEAVTEEGKELVAKRVEESVAAFFQSQSAPTVDDLSGHQAKKQTKAAQAAVREVKRKSRAVVHVQGPGISSARRRKYRRE